MVRTGLKLDTVVVVGAGGIGSHLLSPATKLLMHHPNGTYKIFVADGDHFEPKP